MGFSFWHLLIIIAITVFLFRPQWIQRMGYSLGIALKAFKKGYSEPFSSTHHSSKEIDVTPPKYPSTNTHTSQKASQFPEITLDIHAHESNPRHEEAENIKKNKR